MSPRLVSNEDALPATPVERTRVLGEIIILFCEKTIIKLFFFLIPSGAPRVVYLDVLSAVFDKVLASTPLSSVAGMTHGARCVSVEPWSTSRTHGQRDRVKILIFTSQISIVFLQ